MAWLGVAFLYLAGAWVVEFAMVPDFAAWHEKEKGRPAPKGPAAAMVIFWPLVVLMAWLLGVKSTAKRDKAEREKAR